jgi:hypothetical protein
LRAPIGIAVLAKPARHAVQTFALLQPLHCLAKEPAHLSVYNGNYDLPDRRKRGDDFLPNVEFANLWSDLFDISHEFVSLDLMPTVSI